MVVLLLVFASPAGEQLTTRMPVMTSGEPASGDPFLKLRRRMVREQIENSGIVNAEVLRVLLTTPRHLFVPAPIRSMAYEDRPLPIGHSATISEPYIVALMTEILNPAKTDRVLEIGTGSGYQTAVLAQLANQVYTMEIVPELAESARHILTQLGYRNVVVREGDGYKGWPEAAPFDRIMVTAAPPEIPPALIVQLARGGRLVAPIGAGWDQQLVLVEKGADGGIRRQFKGDVLFVPMRRGEK
jgi:protein-L-isoaspartate(D-aspartate) O-methyltransferase